MLFIIIDDFSVGGDGMKRIGMINPIFVFDLDGTLVDTDEANSLAYQKSIRDITDKQIPLDGRRITRESLKKILNDDDGIIGRIVSRKEAIFMNYLDKTIPLPALKLVQYLTCVNVVLLTSARRERAISVLEYHHAKSFFNNMYFREDYGEMTKFEYLRTQLTMNLSDIILFENEQEMIKEAVIQGIPSRNIYQQL